MPLLKSVSFFKFLLRIKIKINSQDGRYGFGDAFNATVQKTTMAFIPNYDKGLDGSWNVENKKNWREETNSKRIERRYVG